MKAAEVAAEGGAAAGDGGDGNAAAGALASGSASSEYMEDLVAVAKKAVRWVF